MNKNILQQRGVFSFICVYLCVRHLLGSLLGAIQSDDA